MLVATKRPQLDPEDATVFGWLRRAFGGSAKRFERDDTWVLVGLLLSTAFTIGDLSEADSTAIEAICESAPNLRTLSGPRLAELTDDHMSQLRAAKHVADHIKSVAAGASKDISFRASTFALCAELASLSPKATAATKRALEAVAAGLGLPPIVRREILTVLGWKHSFRPLEQKVADKLARQPRRKLPAGEAEWTRGQCVLALVLGMAYCDGSASMDDDAAVNSLLRRARIIGEIVGSNRLFGVAAEADPVSLSPPEAVARAQQFASNSFRPMLNFRGLFAITHKAARALPRNRTMARAIYATCADVAFADRDATPAEERYLHDIGVRLRVPKRERDVIRRVMAWKNRNGISSLATAVGR